jgi:hypothetical protein
MAQTLAAFAPVTTDDVLERAVTHLGRGIYGLGAGAPYTESTPYAPKGNPYPGKCDCSGFVAWCLRYKRGPWNTDAIVTDARHGGNTWTLVSRDDSVRPSDVLVYPGPDRDHDGERDAPGHCGVVVSVLPEFERGRAEWWESLRVAHCSPRRQRDLGAIRLSDATLWAGRGYLVRARHVSPSVHTGT